jgi:hypothetical protein
MPYGEERALQKLLDTPGVTRDMLVSIVVAESTKNKPLRTTLGTFMARDEMLKFIEERDQELAAAAAAAAAEGDAAAAAGGGSQQLSDSSANY